MLLCEDGVLLFDCQPQSEKNFSFGGESAIFSFFDSVKSQGRNAGQTSEFGLAQHLGLANSLYVILLIHYDGDGRT